MKLFRQFIASVVEGAIVGVSMFILFNILDIEIITRDFTIIVVASVLITALAGGIARLIAKGETPFHHEWVFQYGDNRIDVVTGLTEKLYINDKLVDKSKGVHLNQVSLKGKLATGEDVTATIIGAPQLTCKLLIANKELAPIVTRGDLIG